MTFASFLKDYITDRRMTQSEFAIATGVSLDTIKAYLKGYRNPSQYNLKCLFADDIESFNKAATICKNSNSETDDTRTASNIIPEFIPSAIFGECDFPLFCATIPTGIMLLSLLPYDKKCGIEDCLSIREKEFTEEEWKKYQKYDAIADFTGFWKKASGYHISPYNSEQVNEIKQAITPIEVLKTIPECMRNELYDFWLSIKSNNHLYFCAQHFVKWNQVAYCCRPIPGWTLSLRAIYDLCMLAAGSSVITRFACHNDVYIKDIKVDNTPKGIGNWAYREFDLEHDKYYPLCYDEILDKLIYRVVTLEDAKDERTILQRITNSDEKTNMYQTKAILTDKGKAYMKWYETNVLHYTENQCSGL